jgi:hypothetical protein
MKVKWSLWFLLCSVMLMASLYGCKGRQATQPNREVLEYVPGQVVVETTAYISLDYFEFFVDSLHLSIIQRNYDRYYFWIEVDSDSVAAVIIELSKIYSLFTGVSEGEYPYSDANPMKKYLFAAYKFNEEASDTSEGKIEVERLGMFVKRIIIQPREPEIHAVLSIPVGKEIQWAEKLEGYPFIKYAEPNYIFHVMD